MKPTAVQAYNPALRRQGQEDQAFRVILSYREFEAILRYGKLCLKRQNQIRQL